MKEKIEIGKKIDGLDFLELLPPDEGEIDLIYGHIGAGKTYAATADILEDLKRGQIWYVNWKIDFKGYDERQSKISLLGRLLGLKKEFYNFPKENLHYMDLRDPLNVIVDGKATGQDFITWIAGITDAKLGFDEAHIVWSSYMTIKIDPRLQNAALWTRHFERSYLMVTQRPMNIHTQIRDNVNRFYKLEKIADYHFFGHHITFRRTEFQDTDNNGRPDETRIKKLDEDTHMLKDTEEYQYALSQKEYSLKKEIAGSYDSKYRREGMKTSQPNYAQVFHISWKEALAQLFTSNKIKEPLKIESLDGKVEIPKPPTDYYINKLKEK